jgi:LmbE family N-acetylglucosaminyl deacetylase
VPRRLLAILILAFPPSTVAAQLSPPTTGGYAALDLALRKLGHHKRVLMIAAHPDDEDTELLAVLGRGAGAETAYLSLNRGEGGQNLIGNELGEALGLLRTEELLAARRLDGARQFFTRAYDFGFSKNLDDTWSHWPRDSILKDVVRIVRRFQPQVVVSVFSGTSRDGHGQHQAAGWAAREAFRVAGDSTVFPELLSEEGLAPFAPGKLYRSTRFDTAATTLAIEGGILDPAVGQSYHQIAMRGRSLHRSQDMGQLQRIGPSKVRLQLLDDRTRGGDGLWSGLDTALAAAALVTGLPGESGRRATAALDRYLVRVDSARSLLASPVRQHLAGLLARAGEDLEVVRRLTEALPLARRRGLAGQGGVGSPVIEAEITRLGIARVRGLDLVLDGVSEDARVIPGQRVQVTASLWNAGDSATPARMCLAGRVGWSLLVDSVTREGLFRSPRRGACLRYDRTGGWLPHAGRSDPIPSGALVSARVEAAVPEARDYSTPYFLRLPRAGDLYQWDPDDRTSWGLPFEDPLLTAAVELDSEPETMGETREITLRGNDQASGEFRRPVLVVPRVDVRLDPELEIWPLGQPGPRTFTVTLTHGARDSTRGRVALRLPEGWREPVSREYRLTREDEQATFRFSVRPPAGLRPGTYEVAALVTAGRGSVYDVGLGVVDHPHIRPRSWARRAAASVRVVDLDLPRLRRIAYIRGAADRLPEALQAIGLRLDVLRGADLARDLTRYDVVVVGPRAFETDPGLPAANERLLAYVRGGGTAIVQYQQYGYFLGDFAPYRLTVGSRPPGAPNSAATVTSRPDSARAGSPALLGGHDRVADETAPVSILAPQSPVVRYPNRIRTDDWNDWVQERGLYFARSWDSAWQPLLETHDPGEPPLRGGLLLARVGKGNYVYTGLSFFRQLPAGVPGAWRLFLNLLAVGERRATSPRTPATPRDTLKVERE